MLLRSVLSKATFVAEDASDKRNSLAADQFYFSRQ